MNQFLKKIITSTGPKPFFKKKFIYNDFLLNQDCEYIFKNNTKNKNKIFYVIRRSPGAGLFSNVVFVINQLIICDKYKFIPVIDMENFTTIYNEKEKVNNTYNAWEYYFEKINNYSLKEVYKSQNVILNNILYKFITKKNAFNISIDLNKKKYLKYIKKIKIKKFYLNKAQEFFKNSFSNKERILGVHFRGSTYKTASGHAYPSTISEMIKNINYLLNKFNYNKIFLVTEEKKYLEALKKEFGNKLFSYNSYRMDTIDSFKIYPRKLHRYPLGKETLIEAIILSKCDGLTYVKSHIASFAKILSKKKQADHEIFFGYNTRNKYFSRWSWYLKLNFPFIFGKIKLKKKPKNYF